MKETVDTAYVDKCSEIGDVLNLAYDDVADLELLEERLLKLGFLGDKHLLSVADDTVPAGVKLRHHELNFLIFVFAQIFLVEIGYETCRYKYSRALDARDKTASKHLNDGTFYRLLILESLVKLLISLLKHKTLICQLNLTVAVVLLHDFGCQLIAHMHHRRKIRVRFIRIFITRDNPVGLVADIKYYFVGFHIDNGTVDYVAVMNCLYRVLQHLLKSHLRHYVEPPQLYFSASTRRRLYPPTSRS